MSTGSITVRRATEADTEGLAATFAEAFQVDPVLNWCYPDADAREQVLPEVFGAVLAATIPHGGVETTERHESGSIWVPPGAEVDEETMVQRVAEVSDHYTERFLTLMGLLDDHHPTDREHQYLFILGTRTAWQSKGLGSALIRSVTVGCDGDRVPAYLEATSERNRWLYERHGFEIMDVLHLPDGPPLWCMWRAPTER